MADVATSSTITGLPKVELHLHLETSLRLRRLLERQGAAPVPLERAHLVADPARFAGYDRLRRLRYAGRAARVADGVYTRENVAAITSELLREAAADGLRHVEVRVGGQRAFALLGVRGMLEAMAEGAASAGRDVSYGAIVTLVRERGPEAAEHLVTEAAACRDCHVVGVDLAGDEENYQPALFTAAMTRARDAGLGVTIHAGEFSGPAGVWTAVYHLGATRIGHGIRSVEDRGLMDRLRERGVVLELCPTSNIRLGLVPSLATHPIRQFLSAGVPVTINSDDPVRLGTSLPQELKAVAEAHRLDTEALMALMVTAARAAFLPARARAALERKVRSAPLPAG